MASDLEEAFGGGGYTARQRAALLNLIWDHVSSGLDGRESTYEMHANGGAPAWRMRMRTLFKDYNHLANAVLRALAVDMPPIDVSSIAAPQFPGGAVPGAPLSASPPRSDIAADLRSAGQWLGGNATGAPPKS